MEIEELTKSQIVLLTLLISFVTSMATGIVAVSLAERGVVPVTNTVNQIVERTKEVIVKVRDDTATSTEHDTDKVDIGDSEQIVTVSQEQVERALHASVVTVPIYRVVSRSVVAIAEQGDSDNVSQESDTQHSTGTEDSSAGQDAVTQLAGAAQALSTTTTGDTGASSSTASSTDADSSVENDTSADTGTDTASEGSASDEQQAGVEYVQVSRGLLLAGVVITDAQHLQDGARYTVRIGGEMSAPVTAHIRQGDTIVALPVHLNAGTSE